MSSSARKRLIVVFVFVLCAVVAVLGRFGLVGKADTEPAAPMAPFVGGVSASKSAVLQTDVNGNGFVNPGDTLGYTVVVSNTGTDATNTVFTDQLNANLTLVGGSLQVSPIAQNDTYNTI